LSAQPRADVPCVPVAELDEFRELAVAGSKAGTASSSGGAALERRLPVVMHHVDAILAHLDRSSESDASL
jgi:hypothetical protein